MACRDVTEADGLSEAQKVVGIRALLDRGQTGAFDRVKDDLAATGQDRSWFDILEAQSLRSQNRLSSILQAISFDRDGRTEQLTAAIDNFLAQERNVGLWAPADFLDNDERTALIRLDGTFWRSPYKVFLFQHITAAVFSAEIPELGTVDWRAAAALASLASCPDESGKQTAQSYIKGGRMLPRNIVFMAASSATKFNPDMMSFCDQLIGTGKAHKIALTAVMHKLDILAKLPIRENRNWTVISPEPNAG